MVDSPLAVAFSPVVWALLRRRLRLRFFLAWGAAASAAEGVVSAAVVAPASAGDGAGESIGDGLEVVSLKDGLLFVGGHTPSSGLLASVTSVGSRNLGACS